MSIKRKALPIAITLVLLIPLLNYMPILQTSQLSLEVTPSTGRGRYGETVTVSACGLRPGATVTGIGFVNNYTGQAYSFTVNIPIDETGCFTATIVLGNMSYGLYNVLIYERPPQPPSPLVASDTIGLNETKSVTVSALELGINASITATLSVEAYWGYKNYYEPLTSTGNATSTLFTAEDGEVYLLTVWYDEGYVKFRLYDRDGATLIDSADVVPETVDGNYTATWEFNRAEPEVPGLYNNKAVYTYDSINDRAVLELYHGGRKLMIISAYLRIVYENLDTGDTTEFYYEYPVNLTFTDYGIEPVATDTWTDADAEWYAEFTWDGRTGEAVLTVHVEYQPRTIVFPEKYNVKPVVYIDGVRIENGETIYLWTDYEYVVEFYGFTPRGSVLVKIEGTTYYTGTIDVDGNTSFVYTVPLNMLEPGKWYTVEITGNYTDGVTTYTYTVYIVVSHPAIYINEVHVPSSGELDLGYVCPEYCINIEARGFPPDSVIYLYLNEELYDKYNVGANGNLNLDYNVGDLPYQYNTSNKLFIRVIYDNLEYSANATFIIPAIYVENILVEFGGEYNAGVIPGAKKITVKAYNFPPDIRIAVYLNDNDNPVGTYDIDENGYALIELDRHKSMPPGSTGVYRIIATYNGCVYKVEVIFEIRRIEAYFRIINPITLEYVQEPRGSAGYYNETLIVTRNGEPFDYLGDILEIVVLDGLEPGEKVNVSLVGPDLIELYIGTAGPGGKLNLSQTIPSIPYGDYTVVIDLPERGYSIQIPWYADETITNFTVYPKIVVTRLDSLEVPVVVGSTAVRVFGSGFQPGRSGFVVLLNNTDSIASVNYHSYLFWTVNDDGILVGPGGAQPGITVPLLEPGVYSITLYRENYGVIEAGYVYVVNELANVATKKDVEKIMSKLEEISTRINEVLSNLDYIKPLLEEVAVNIIQMLEQQSQAITLLQEILSTMATRDDIQELMSLVRVVNTTLYDRIDLLELALTELIEDVRSEVLSEISKAKLELVELINAKTAHLEELIADVNTTLYARIDELETTLSGLIHEKTEYLEGVISEVNETLLER
ncbi:MAG: hypothetical protein QXK07_07430, partial [Desulfurococcaceae archaeon]